MEKREIYYLLYICKKAGLKNKLETTTSEIAKDLSISQQSASRILIDLGSKDLIKRTVTNNGITIQLTDNAINQIKNLHLELKNIFEKQTSIKAVVKSGLGEGAFYMKQDNYKEQLKKLLGFEPFEGTLNLKTNKDSVESFLLNKGEIKVKGFETEERTFGSLKCYKVKINNQSAAIVIPERTNYSLETIEIIAKDKLREKLNLEDNDEVVIE